MKTSTIFVFVALFVLCVSAASKPLTFHSKGDHLGFTWLFNVAICDSKSTVNSTQRNMNYTVIYNSNEPKNTTGDFVTVLFLTLTEVNNLRNVSNCTEWVSKGIPLPPTNKTVGTSGSVLLTFTQQEPVIWVGLLNCLTSKLNADVTFTMENTAPVKFECSTYKNPGFGPDVPSRSKSSDWWIAIVILIVLLILGGLGYFAYHCFYARHLESEEHRPIRS